MTPPAASEPPLSLAIVGASVRAVAASAVRSGFRVAAADLFADLDLRRLAPATKIGRYPSGLFDWLRHLRPKPAAWLYAGALENYPELVDAMAVQCPLLGNGGSVLRQVRSPWQLAETYRQAGLLFPETRATAHGLPRDGSWLAKTGRGAGGSGVAVLDAAFEDTPQQTEHFFQRRVAGIPHSAVCTAAGGKATLLGIVRQLVGEEWLGAREFQYCGAIGPCPVTEPIRVQIVRTASLLAERFGLAGLFGVDLVMDGERVWTIEVNPRYTASVEVVERATGVQAVAAHVAACSQRALPDGPGPVPHLIHGKAILFAKRPVTISAAFVEAALAETLQAPWPTVADVSAAGTTIGARRPVVSVFAAGADANETFQNLRQAVARIERTLYSSR